MKVNKLKCWYCKKYFYITWKEWRHEYEDQESHNCYTCCISCRSINLMKDFNESIDKDDIKQFWEESKTNKYKYKIQKLTKDMKKMKLKLRELES